MKMSISNTTFILLLFLSSCSFEPKKELSNSFGTKSEMNYSERQGEFLYNKYCAVCHGAGGEGDGFNAFNLSPKPRDFTDFEYMSNFSDDRLFEAVNQGGRGINKSVNMPSWKNVLKGYQVNYLVSYVRHFASMNKNSDMTEE